MRTRILDIAARLGDHVVSIALALLVLLPALVVVTDSDHRSTGVLPTLATVADTTADDVQADQGEILRLPEGAVLESTPMVPVPGTRYVVPEESPDGGHVLPVVLWLDNSPVYSGPQTWVLHVDDTAQRVTWRLYIDIVSDVNDPAADQYGAGAGAVCGTDAQCRAWDRDHAPASPAVVNVAYATHADELTADERTAARRILERMASGKRIGQSWTWRGAPRAVRDHGAMVRKHFDRSGQRNAVRWLKGVTGGTLAEDGRWVPSNFYDQTTRTGASQAVCDHLGKRRVPDPVYGHRCV